MTHLGKVEEIRLDEVVCLMTPKPFYGSCNWGNYSYCLSLAIT